MFDPFDYLGPKRRKMSDESRAGIFRDHIRQVLPVDFLALRFSANMGRPDQRTRSRDGSDGIATDE